MTITRRLKLKPTPEQRAILMDTLLQYKECINHVLCVGFTNHWTSSSKLHEQTYSELRGKHSIQSQLVCSARVKATETLLSIKRKTKGKWNVNQPESHKYPAIRYDRNSCSYIGQGIKLSTSQGRIEVPLVHYPFVDGIWSKLKTTCELVYKASQDEWYLVAMFDVEPTISQDKGVIGIDRGINHIAVLSNNQFVNSRNLRRVKGKYSYLRRRLQQKGTKSSRRLFKKISGKEHRFVADCNHCISKNIVALPYGVFVLEQLTTHTKKRLGKSFNKRLMGWSWQQLEQFLTYKAELAGKQVEYVDARYTSQKCSKCGHIERANRSGSRFKCKACEYELHADLNAARNIKGNYEAAQGITLSSRASSSAQTYGAVCRLAELCGIELEDG